MNSFDINRFGKTLRWVVSVNFRKMLLWFTGSVLAVFLGEILFKMMSPGGIPMDMIRDVSQFLAMILILVSIIMVSSIVSSINEKRKREAFLMLPSSNLEKFLSLVVYSTVICIAFAFLAIVLGDTLRMLAYWTFKANLDGGHLNSITDNITGEAFYWWSSAIPMMLKELAPVIVVGGLTDYPLDFAIVQNLFIYGGLLWVHSVYTLGGTLLRKYSFVGTTVFVILCITLVVRIVYMFEFSMFYSRWDNGELLEYKIGILGYIIAIAFPILSIVNYWASFHIFKGFQLITTKWTNYDFHK